MKKYLFFILVASFVLLCGCAKVFYSQDAFSIANRHETLAIAPPKVSIAPRKKDDVEALKEQAKNESLNFQHEMYSWWLKRKAQGQVRLEFQDIETTNVKLERAGYSEDNPLTPLEMCEVLGVDALLTSNYSLSKPMSTGGAIATAVLLGWGGATNQATVTLELYDSETKKLFWNYNHKISGSVGSTPAGLVDNLMRNASKKSPYTK